MECKSISDSQKTFYSSRYIRSFSLCLFFLLIVWFTGNTGSEWEQNIRRKEKWNNDSNILWVEQSWVGKLKGVTDIDLRFFLGFGACSRDCSKQVLELNCWSSKLSKLFTPFTNLIKEIEIGLKSIIRTKENTLRKGNDTEDVSDTFENL